MLFPTASDLKVHRSTFNVLYPSILFCLTQISQISQRTHRILAFTSGWFVKPSTFNVHRSLPSLLFVSHKSHKSHRERIVYLRLPPDGSFNIHRSTFIVLYPLYFFPLTDLTNLTENASYTRVFLRRAEHCAPLPQHGSTFSRPSKGIVTPPDGLVKL